MTHPVRVRFAPSPTGPLHIGGLRTALFNYLFAKKQGGTFVLRIEDTDHKRYVPGAENYISESLSWCNIPADESPLQPGKYGPYRQSERKAIYKQYINTLLENGDAYYAFDTAETLDEFRKDHEAKGGAFIYNHQSRGSLSNSLTLTAEEVKDKIGSGHDFVVRFKAPQGRIIEMNDIIRGKITIDCNTLDDKVLFKSDGMPTYHLANVVDDHLMKITHVIRGEEWLPSMALHVLLYEAFGWDKPEFAHLPLILKPSGKGKLSKRDGDKFGFPVFPLDWQGDERLSQGFKGAGYLPEALINFLGLLGWNPGTEEELFKLNEMISAFDLTSVNKAGARFDIDKLKWFNQQYVAQLSVDSLSSMIIANYPQLKSVEHSQLNKIIRITQERLVFVNDFWKVAGFFFEAPQTFEERALKKTLRADTFDILDQTKAILKSQKVFTPEALQSAIKSWISDQQIGFGAVMQPLRLALVGDLKGPDVFVIMSLLGKDCVCSRIGKFQHAIEAN